MQYLICQEEKKFCIFSLNFYYFIFMLKTIKEKNNKDMLMEKKITSSPSM
jgi:hypothetical protein